jgi:hypothetical protein
VPIRRLPLDQAIAAVQSALSLSPMIGHAGERLMPSERSR